MIKYLSLFSGIGAPEEALKNIGIGYELVGFSEIDKFAIESYKAIHNETDEKLLGNITKINIDALPNDIDLITHGSPCQDYSSSGKNKGGNKGSGTRSSLMWYTVDIVSKKKPKVIVWENVKNVLSKLHIHNFNQYIEDLNNLGYNNYYNVLNSKEFNVPQSRERVFVVSIRKDIDNGKFEMPTGFSTDVCIKDILENIDDVPANLFVKRDKLELLFKNIQNKIDFKKSKVGTCHKDNDCTHSTRAVVYNAEYLLPTLCATDYKGPKQILAVGNVNPSGRSMGGKVFSIKGLSPTVLTNKGDGLKLFFDCISEDKSIVLENCYIRKITPNEAWRLMGFSDKSFLKAKSVVSNTQLYKQAGNSIVVPVLEAIFKNIFSDK